MKKFIGIGSALLLCSSLSFAMQKSTQRPENAAHPAPAQAARQPQKTERAPVGNGHIPAHGPTATPKAAPTHATTKGNQRPNYSDGAGHPNAPHVHAKTDQWVGHNTGANDPHYHLDHPWQHGHFPGEVGRSQVYRLAGGARDHFRVGAYFFSVAPYDYDDCSAWLWDSDDIVLYADPDHDGWYLAYDVRLGTYVHVMYLGPA